MKKYIIALLIGLVSSFTTKGQTGEIVPPDSEIRVVPVMPLKYSNMDASPIVKNGDILVLRSYSNGKDINGDILKFPVFMFNRKTNQFIYSAEEEDSRSEVVYIDNQSFFVRSYDQKRIYKTELTEYGMTNKKVYDNKGLHSANKVIELFDGRTIISESRYGIRILTDTSEKEIRIPSTIDVSSLDEYGDLIVFGGYDFNAVGTVNPSTGEIKNISTATISGGGSAFVKVVMGVLYVQANNNLYQYTGSDWILIQEGVWPLMWDGMINEFTVMTKDGVNHIFRNDSLVDLNPSPFLHTPYVESYRDVLVKRYGNNMNFDAWHVFDWEGKTYAMGDGMLGTIQKVAIPGEIGFGRKVVLPTISIYPNPATENVTITGLVKETPVNVINSVGQIVLSVKTTGGDVDISTLTPGLYFASIGGFNPTKFVKK